MNTIGTFLNGEYLTSYVGDSYNNMIEDSSTWYLGTVGEGASYKLSKYTDINMSSLTSSRAEAKVGLLRFGELMSGQFNGSENNKNYWTLTPYSTSGVRNVHLYGNADNNAPTNTNNGVRPSLNLKSNVIITSGDGTLQNPFNITLE